MPPTTLTYAEALARSAALRAEAAQPDLNAEARFNPGGPAARLQLSLGAAATAWERVHPTPWDRARVDATALRRARKQDAALPALAVAYAEHRAAIAAIKARHARRCGLGVATTPATPAPPARPPSRIQTLLFPKDLFTARAAQSWAAAHGFHAPAVDHISATRGLLHLQQFAPGVCAPGTLRTITLGESGARAVVCRRRLMRRRLMRHR